MPRQTGRKLQIESLEERKLMAGDVSVYFDSYNRLHVEGDNYRNQVDIRQVSPGVLTIKGETIGGDYTRVNGYANGTITARTVAQDVIVNLYGGDDALNVGTGDARVINFPKNLWINAGTGSDWTAVRDVTTGGTLSVVTGTGVDTTFVNNAKIGDDLIVGDSGGAVNVGDRDVVTINNSTVKDQMAFYFRQGNDSVNINSCVADRIFADMADGNDTFQMNFSRSGSQFAIYGGNGYDTFFVPSYNGTRWWGNGFEKVTNQ